MAEIKRNYDPPETYHTGFDDGFRDGCHLHDVVHKMVADSVERRQERLTAAEHKIYSLGKAMQKLRKQVQRLEAAKRTSKKRRA